MGGLGAGHIPARHEHQNRYVAGVWGSEKASGARAKPPPKHKVGDMWMKKFLNLRNFFGNHDKMEIYIRFYP